MRIRILLIAVALLLFCSIAGAQCTTSGTTVVLAGQTLHLCDSPRVQFNPTLVGLMTGTSGSGRFQSGSVTYLRLYNSFNSYCSTKYGYLNAQAYNTLDSGPPLVCGAIAAALWMSNGSNLSDTTYLPVAMWSVTHVEELNAGSFGCNEAISYCGNSDGEEMDFNRINLVEVAYIYTILKGEGALSPTQIQLFADKILNGNPTTSNGTGGNYANLTSQCVNQGFNTGTGTLSVSGTAINFSSGVLNSNWVGAALFNTAGTQSIGRIASVTNSTTGVLSRSEPTQSNVSYIYSYAWVQNTGSGIGNCGELWWLWHDVDALKWYSGTEQQWPTNYPPDGGNYSNLAVTFPSPTDWWDFAVPQNNKMFTQVDGNLAIAIALADDDVRAANLVQSVYDWYYKYSLPVQSSAQTPYTMAGAGYQDERDLWMALDVANMLCSSFYETGSGTPCALASGMTWLQRVPSYYAYAVRTSNATTTQNPNGSIDDSWAVTTGSLVPEYFPTRAICEAGYIYPSLADSKYMTYVDRNVFGYNSQSNHAIDWIWDDYAYCDPAQAQASISGASKQFLFQDTDYTACIGNSTWVANGSCTANRSVAFFSSRTGWSTTDTLVTGAGGYRYLAADHMANEDWGHFQISKNDAPLLYYDNVSTSINPGYAMNDIALGGDSNWGTADNSSEGFIMGWSHIDRWAGSDPYGDPNNNYTYALINMNPGGTSGAYTNVSAYTSAAYAGRVNRSIIHFKKAGYQDYVTVYDDVTNTASGGESIRAYQHFFLQTPGTYSTVTITPSSGGTNYGTVVNTNTSGPAMLNSTYLPVAGTNTLALAVDNANGSYSGGAGYTARAYMCPSTDGTTCNNSATSYEGIAIHMPIAATSGSMPAITQPVVTATGGNATAVQIADSSSPKVAMFARQGVTLTAASFTTTFTGTAQHVIAGLTPGSYAVTVNSTPVSGSPFTVNSGDNTLYFESTDGAVVISASGSPPVSGTPSFSPGAGTYSSTQSVTISATGGAVICYSTTGSPATNGTTGCTTGTLYTSPVSVSTSETLYAVSGGTGYTDSSVGSAAYTITGATPAGVAPQLLLGLP